MPHPFKPKMIVLLMAGSLLLVLLYVLWSSDSAAGQSSAAAGQAQSGQSGRAERPATVKTERSRRQDLTVSRDLLATIAPLNQVVVRPQISGQIEQLYFEEGQALKAGQLMATLDSRTLRAELVSSEAELARIQSQLEVAQAEQRRYQSLLSTQAVSQQEVAELAGQTQQLQAQLNAAKANLQAQQVRVSLTRIVAPISGRVGLRQVSVGAQVSSNDSNGIATLTQTQPISVRFGVPEQLLGAESLQGQPIEVRTSTGDQVLAQTRISRQDSQVDATTGSVSVRAILPNPDERLLSGQSVRVRMAQQSLRQVVTVPTRAIQQGLNQTFVYVVKDGAANMTPIRRLAQQGEVSAVDGIAADVDVVVEGQLRLKDGSKVQAADAPSTTSSEAKPSSTATGAGR
ncbi:MAG: efflux RND transporter periplasmic adaptor subunit [Moraxellaceae bacterium]